MCRFTIFKIAAVHYFPIENLAYFSVKFMLRDLMIIYPFSWNENMEAGIYGQRHTPQ